jgi:hypothetical protein
MWTADYNNRGRGWRSKEFVPSAPRKRDNAFTRLSVSSFRGVAFRERDEFVVRGLKVRIPLPPPESPVPAVSAAHYRPELLRVESRHARHRGSRQEFA